MKTQGGSRPSPKDGAILFAAEIGCKLQGIYEPSRQPAGGQMASIAAEMLDRDEMRSTALQSSYRIGIMALRRRPKHLLRTRSGPPDRRIFGPGQTRSRCSSASIDCRVSDDRIGTRQSVVMKQVPLPISIRPAGWTRLTLRQIKRKTLTPNKKQPTARQCDGLSFFQVGFQLQD